MLINFSNILQILGQKLINFAIKIGEDKSPPPPPPPPIRNAFEYSHEEWLVVQGDKTLRLDYNIGSDAIVLDVGGFEGQWASDIYSKYCCTIHIFEPMPKFARLISLRFKQNSDILVHPFAIGGVSGETSLTVAGDASSIVGRSDCSVNVPIRSFSEWYQNMDLGEIDLMKINIEGSEYELLEHMIETGVINRIKNIQIQFHAFVDDAEQSMKNITKKLRLTHLPTYRYWFVWENWQLRTPGDSTRLQLLYRSIKTRSGVLDPNFVRDLVDTFELEVFIETGTYLGDTLGAQLKNFDSLISIELDQALYETANERFSNYSSVTLLKGDSTKQLQIALEIAGKRPSLIWLDAHYSGLGTSKGASNTLILLELQTVLGCGSGQDIILIDDLRFFTTRAERTTDHPPEFDGYPTARELSDILVDKGYSIFVVCDALMAIPDLLMNDVKVSRVLQACTDLRIGDLSEAQRNEAEIIISNADDVEAQSLQNIPQYILDHKHYGTVDNYLHWQSLLTANKNRSVESFDFE